MHNYLIFNLAIGISYILAKIFNKVIIFSHTQTLRFSRYILLLVVALFVGMPLLSSWFPVGHSHFQLGPMMRILSDNVIIPHHAVSQEIMHSNTSSLNFSAWFWAEIMLGIGIGLFLYKYLRNIIELMRIRKNSFCQRRIHNVYCLINKDIDVPFCWSFFHKHYIVMPIKYLENTAELKLALRHELQHIRQADTQWLHGLSLIKVICFWNPFVTLWIRYLDSLQEFSCDEAMFVRKKTSPVAYAQCLLNAISGMVPQNALGIRGLSQSILYRRITMVLDPKNVQAKKLSIIGVYVVALLSASTAAYAINGQSSDEPLSTQQVEKLIQQSHFDKSFQISATPEVVKELNNIRHSDDATAYMQASLNRMQKYQDYIQHQLNKKNMPHELLAIPLVESGYQALPPNVNPVQAAGIWQIIPQTAVKYGLVVNGAQDDRMDTTLSTQGALRYLDKLHTQFNNWGLAAASYEIGENSVANLIKQTGSQDVWTLAHSSKAPKDLGRFLATFDASLIIMKNPGVLK